MSKAIFRNTAIFAVLTILTQVLAVLRDVVLVRMAGVGSLLDTYYMAFKIPDLLSGFYMIFLGTAVFVPLVTRAQKEGGDVEVVKKLREVGSFVMIIILSLFVIIFLALPYLTQLLVPHWDIAQQMQMINLSRILLLAQLIFPLGTICGALCMIYNRISYAAISSALYNLGILLGAWLLFPSLGIYGVAVGVVLGATMFFVVQAAPTEVHNILFQYKLTWHLQTISNFVSTNISRFFSVFIWQVFVLMLFYISAQYGESSVSIFNIAYGIDVSLISIIGASVSSVMLPLFSKMHVDNDEGNLQSTLTNSVYYTFYFSIIVAMFFYIFSLQFISILYSFSNVSAAKLVSISSVFAIFMLSLPLQNNFEILRRYLYATEKVVAVSIMMIAFMLAFLCYVFSIKTFWPGHDTVNTLAQGFLFGNLCTSILIPYLYRKHFKINYLQLFHKLFPLLVALPIASLIWYFMSTHYSFLESSNIFIFTIQNALFMLIILFSLLYIFKDFVVRSLLHKLAKSL